MELCFLMLWNKPVRSVRSVPVLAILYDVSKPKTKVTTMLLLDVQCVSSRACDELIVKRGTSLHYA